MSTKNSQSSELLNRTKKLCQENNIKPSKFRGQNFLINEDVYNQIIASADLDTNDIVLEVGPGLGFLTEKLAQKAKKVIAVEVDKKLANLLEKRLKKQGLNNIQIINEDILNIPNTKYNTLNNKYKIVANLPYNITSIFLRKFLSAKNKPSLAVLMLQKEVAQRIAASPPNMSLLAVSVQFYSDPEMIDVVSQNDFWPIPQIDSAIIKLKIYPKFEVDEKKLFRLVKFGFSSRRKMLKNNLSAGFRISASIAEERIKKAGFNEKIRAQNLAVNDWLKLFEVFKDDML